MPLSLGKLKKRPVEEARPKPKKKVDRFGGVSEEEVQKHTLEDILELDLDLVFVGINPSLMAAHRGRYYAGPGNHFYKLLHESGLVPRFVSFEEDQNLLNYKIGLTNVVARATKSSADLKRSEIQEGATIVRAKLSQLEPKIAVFNGKCIYEVFAEKNAKSEFHFGLQPEKIGKTAIWVVPSSSARCAHFPRMTDKLHFYQALKKYLSYLKGEIDQVDPAEFRFEGKCKQVTPSTSIMWRRKNVSAFLHGGKVANKNTMHLDSSTDSLGMTSNEESSVSALVAENNGNFSPENAETSEEKAKERIISPRKRKLTSCSESFMSSTTQATKENHVKKPIKLSPMKEKPSRIIRKIHDSNQAVNFMDLIKKRLSEKKGGETATDETTKPLPTAGEVKKLKYSNLKLNLVGKKSEALGD